jgi:hypothetical protein
MPTQKRAEQIAFEAEYLKQFMLDNQALVGEVLELNDKITEQVVPVSILLSMPDDRTFRAADTVLRNVRECQTVLVRLIELSTSMTRLAEGRMSALSRELQGEDG